MSVSQPAIDALLRERFGDRPFRVAEAVEAGVSRTTLYRLRRGGELEAPMRGVLQLPGAGLGMLSNLAAVSVRAPRATICLNSALSFWDLSDELPVAVHIAVPRGSRLPAIAQPATVVHVFKAETFSIGRERELTDDGEPFWIYSPERTVVDAFRMARWVGRDVAAQALRRYLAERASNPAKLTEVARQVGGLATLGPALETLLS